MPHELTDSSASFQCCIDETLRGIEGVAVYVDGILIFAETIEVHDDILQLVLR